MNLAIKIAAAVVALVFIGLVCFSIFGDLEPNRQSIEQSIVIDVD